MRKLLCSLIISFLIISCKSGISKEELTSRVRSDINKELQKRASGAGISLKINSFNLIHKGGKEYSGILKTSEAGEEFTYQVDVTADGDSYMWKIVE